MSASEEVKGRDMEGREGTIEEAGLPSADLSLPGPPVTAHRTSPLEHCSLFGYISLPEIHFCAQFCSQKVRCLLNSPRVVLTSPTSASD
jgi:hypothetical protein